MSRNFYELKMNFPEFLQLGNFEFDLTKKELRNSTGNLVRLRAQSAEVLLALSQTPNEIVSKDQLIDRVWHGAFVADDNLVQCIADVRRALGKSGYTIIETFPKNGYRLNASLPKTFGVDTQIKPTIAVLPFVNLTDDPDQNVFVDGMTEDIIAGLSRFRSLFVIARNSSFFYQGKLTEVYDVARELGVRYILSGSVHRAGKRIRIKGQLADTVTGNHLWAEHYDREAGDIFELQDEITEKIVATIAPEIDFQERQYALKKSPDSLGVWEIYQRALTSHQSAMGDDCKTVVKQFDEVCKLDPGFAPAFAMAASSRVRYALLFEPDDRKELLNQAVEVARRGITLDQRDSTCLWAYGRALSLLGHHDEAISSIKDAVSLNPNDAMAHYYLAIAMGSAGRLDEAVSALDHALRLSPHDVPGGGFRTYRAFLMFDLERYNEALECAQQAVREPYPLSIPFEVMVAALIKLNCPEEAEAALKMLVEHTPGTSLSNLSKRPWIGRPETKVRYLDALHQAGLQK